MQSIATAVSYRGRSREIRRAMSREHLTFEFWRRCLLDESLRQEPQDTVMDLSHDDVMKPLRKDWVTGIFSGHAPDVTALAVGVSIPLFESRCKPRARTGFSSLEAQSDFVWAPFHVPGLLHRDGQLTPHPTASPWFSRQFLEPRPEDAVDETPVVATMMAVAERLADLSKINRFSWETWLDGALEMFCQIVFGTEEVPDQPFAGHRVGEGITFVATSRARLFLLSEKGKPQEALLGLYERLQDQAKGDPGNRLPGSLMRLAGAPMTGSCAAAGGPDAGDHGPVAVMTGKGGLDGDQRRVVVSAMALADHDILSVEGPPGTGKTTVISSLVASSWVAAAITADPLDAEEAPAPSLIASTNNRALVNAAESMCGAPCHDHGPRTAALSARWLPGIKGYALMLPASSRAENAVYEPFDIAWRRGPSWHGAPADVFTPRYLDGASTAWMERHVDAFPDTPPGDLTVAICLLHGTLRRVSAAAHELSQAGLALRAEGSAPRPVIVRSLSQTERTALLGDIRNNLDQFGGFNLARRIWESDRTQIAAKGMILPADFDALNTLMEAQGGAAVDVSDALMIIEEWFGQDARTRMERGLFQDPAGTDIEIDKTLGRLMFWIAGRFWEGMWLRRMTTMSTADLQSLLSVNGVEGNQAPRARVYLWGMIWPCLITTFHSAPRVMAWSTNRGKPRGTWADMPLIEVCDTLIVDEAGQSLTSVAAPVFALARRAVVIGDRHQIRPVSRLDPIVLHGHAAEVFGSEEADRLIETPLSEGGNIECGRIATLSLMHQVASERPDVLLRRHRRCVPSIIAYCNDLVYDGALVPVRDDLAQRLLPAWSFGHIDGQAHRVGASWSNTEEATAVAQWIAGRADALRDHYGTKALGQIVAVVTPYSAQAALITRALAGVAPDVPVGTVHAVQGGEWPVVVFSPVRTASARMEKLFFNQDPSMFNVLVSRARDSIVMIGDTGLFKQMGEQTPGGRFAERLFTDGTVLPDVGRRFITTDDVSRIATHADCRRTLVNILEAARRRVLIVSPYLSDRTLTEDVVFTTRGDDVEHRVRVIDAINAAVGRGVEVVVVTDDMLNGLASSSPDWKPSADAARASLAAVGATIWVVDGMHNKTLAMDDAWIAEGSYNWLSAVAEESSRFHRHETVLCYGGDGAGEMVAAAWTEAETRRRAANERRQKSVS